MIANRMKSTLPLTALAAMIVMLVGTGGAQAAPAKFLFSSHIGWNVNTTKVKEPGATQQEKNVCTVESQDECQIIGEESTGPGGFNYPFSVAVAPNGNVYVADTNNNRVQEITSTGIFVLMFGWNVNETKVKEPGATQQEKNVCTATEVKNGVKCQAGEAGALTGQMQGAYSVAVDQANGNDVWVENLFNWRVDKYTANGQFVLTIGGEVNETAHSEARTSEENICPGPAHPLDKCKAGVRSAPGSTAHGAFKFGQGHGNLLAVGGPQDLLYVGDEGRVQKFEASGKWAGEVSLTGLSKGVAVDSSGNVFVAAEGVAGVREYDGAGVLQSCVIDPASTRVEALALDAYGRLGIVELEVLGANARAYGVLYSTQAGNCGKEISRFAPPSGEMPGFPDGLAFDTSETPSKEPPSDRLYTAGVSAQEIGAYVPVRFPEVLTCPAEEVMATNATLCGEINPEGLLTTGFFDYGTSPALGSQTPVAFKGKGVTFEPVHWQLPLLLPNKIYYFKAVAEAEVKGTTGQAQGEILSFHTTTPPPEVPGEPSASFVKAQSAMLNASVNPEHATTRYRFEYAACKNENQSLTECGEVKTSAELESAQYGLIGVTQEARGLAPQTPYRFRLVANSEFEYQGKPEGGKTPGAEGMFKTGPAPVPQATTGSASAITATSALVSGTVNPDGQPATYAFELGVYNGAATQYGVVFSGPAGASAVPVEETLALTGLQPGVTYAYRIKVASGYGEATGQTMTFPTAGLPEVLPVATPLAMLAVPNIAFPKEPAKVTSKKLTRAQQLARALKACAKQPKSKRAACKRSARKKYVVSKKARKSGPRGKGAHRTRR